MDIFEPSNFRNIFDIASSFITGLLALVGVYYAIQTYFVAKEAKDEWKRENSLSILIKFSKAFPSSREFIFNLRSPYILEIELDEAIGFTKDMGWELTSENTAQKIDLIHVSSRYRKYESKLNDFFDLEHEILFIYGDSNIITKYIQFIKETKNSIFHSADQIGYYNLYLEDKNLSPNERIEFRNKIKYHKKIIYSIEEDDISNNLIKLYNECEEFLKYERKRFKLQ